MIRWQVTPRMRCVDWNKWDSIKSCRAFSGHTSYEVCGLKYIRIRPNEGLRLVTPRMRCVDWNLKKKLIMTREEESHLVWGVWIEISSSSSLAFSVMRHTSYEVCGLKFDLATSPDKVQVSHLVWGVWIEITVFTPMACRISSSHLVWGVWIEICGATMQSH